MLGKRVQKSTYSLGMKNNKKASLIGQRVMPLNANKNGLMSYNSNEPKKSYLEK
jgi:hypothetical protein